MHHSDAFKTKSFIAPGILWKQKRRRRKGKNLGTVLLTRNEIGKWNKCFLEAHTHTASNCNKQMFVFRDPVNRKKPPILLRNNTTATLSYHFTFIVYLSFVSLNNFCTYRAEKKKLETAQACLCTWQKCFFLFCIGGKLKGNRNEWLRCYFEKMKSAKLWK